MNDLYNGDCIEVMQSLPSRSIDAIICDPPYAITKASWDTLVPMDQMWEQLNRLIKPKCNIVLFGQQPFTTDLINSNRKKFRHSLVWHKVRVASFMNAKNKCLPVHEDILLFGDSGAVYNPQMQPGSPYVQRLTPVNSASYGQLGAGISQAEQKFNSGRYPTSIITVPRPLNSGKERVHGHQKPEDLLAYLIKTYSNEGDVVLDFTMGSGSTGIAAVQTGRDFVGIELNKTFFKLAKARIEKAKRRKSVRDELLCFGT